MPITVGGTAITFNDSTTQNTAFTGVPTTLGAVGTYAILIMAANNNLAVNGTIAGSSLRYGQTIFPTGSSPTSALGPYWSNLSGTYNAGGTALSGTWRKMNTGISYTTDNIDGTIYYFWWSGLYLRIS